MRGNVGVRLSVAIDVVGVDVAAAVGLGGLVVGAQRDAAVVVGHDVGVAVLGLVGVEQGRVRAEHGRAHRAGDLFVELHEAEVAVHVHLLHVELEEVDAYGVEVLVVGAEQGVLDRARVVTGGFEKKMVMI